MFALLIAAVAGFVFASLVEYVVHRLMHAGVINGQRHAEHHRDGWGQGFWPEFGDYLLPASPLLAPPWFFGWAIGAGWTLGALVFSAFSAYAHQLQHDSPVACRWMRMPVHYVHHRDQMWHHNFGMALDWWDRVFGTYRAVPFGAELSAADRARGPLEIHWRRTDGAGQILTRPQRQARGELAAAASGSANARS
jgi:sterol desaturase/sphingolipid hydroxylase (fatty acid hydroxylase superfamily)